MKKFDKNKINEGELIFKKIMDSLVIDPKDLNLQYSNIDCPKWFVEFGERYELFRLESGFNPNNYKIYLTSKGRDIYSKGGFKHFYRYEVLFPREINKYNYYIHRYWWISIVLSAISLIISIIK